jgi:xanthine dehydrogenase accessory factor
VAVLADLVARRAAGQMRAAATPTPREAVDPVCGMTVFVDRAKYHTVHAGTDYWFCAPGCLHAFESDPGAFVG